MSWAITNGVWLKSGTARECVMSATKQGTNYAVTLRMSSVADKAKAMVMSSPEGHCGYEVGIEGSNLIIRRVRYGTPGSALSTNAHGVAPSTTTTIDVRVSDRKITVYLNGALTPVAYTVPDDDLYASQPYVGFVSTTSGAVVLGFDLWTLVARTVSAAKVLAAIGGGQLWAAEDVNSIRFIDGRATSATADIDSTEYYQKLLIVDGAGSHKKFDPVLMKVTQWSRTGAGGGTLPPFTLIESHLNRVIGVDADNRQNLRYSAAGDEDDFDDSSTEQGAAFSVGPTVGPRIGEPARMLLSVTNTTLLVGGLTRLFNASGDPALGSVYSIDPIGDSGVSGKDAARLDTDGRGLIHGPIGFYATGGGVLVERISRPTLTARMELSDADQRYVIVVGDRLGNGVYIFLTRRDGNPTTHWYYHFATKGFYPITFAADHEPTSACLWGDLVVLGCRDGYLRTFNPDARNDDGELITSIATLTIAAEEDLSADTLIESARIELGEGSSNCDVRFYGGRTPEEACDPQARTILAFKRTAGLSTVLAAPVRSPAIAIELRTINVDERIVLEAAQIQFTSADRLDFTRTKEIDLFPSTPGQPTAPGNPSAPTTGPGGSISTGTGGGGGGGGGGETGGGGSAGAGLPRTPDGENAGGGVANQSNVSPPQAPAQDEAVGPGGVA